MTDIVRFKYNKGFAFTTISGLVLLTVVINMLNVPDRTGIYIADVYFALLTIYFTFKAVIPAAKGKTALELNSEEIIDYVTNRNVRLDNVQDIRQVNAKGSSGIAIELIDRSKFLKDKTFFQKIRCFLAILFFNTPIVISLQYIEGDNKQILQKIKSYLDKKNGSQHEYLQQQGGTEEQSAGKLSLLSFSSGSTSLIKLQMLSSTKYFQ